MASISVRLTDKSKQEIKALAKDLEKTMSDITRELLEGFINNEKEKKEDEHE